MDDVKREHEPFTRLTSLGNEMCAALPDDVKAIVLLTDKEMNGSTLANWDDDIEAVAHMFMHMKAIMKAAGKELKLITEEGVFLE